MWMFLFKVESYIRALCRPYHLPCCSISEGRIHTVHSKLLPVGHAVMHGAVRTGVMATSRYTTPLRLSDLALCKPGNVFPRERSC